VCPADDPPRITGILETVLYVADLDRAERFYREVMALKLIGKEADRHNQPIDTHARSLQSDHFAIRR